ncbi:MAG: hypothetical protein KIT24_11195 [Phycisphaeraceae bacterium]|nr:hypothetical protein [Phycisphaeraceae bacterium]
MMHPGRERELAQFAREIGSEHVVWGLQLLHVESRTSLQPVSEWSDTRSRGRIYNPATGRYDQRFRGTHRTHTTAYVPVIEDRAYYAFRAVFYRSLTGR